MQDQMLDLKAILEVAKTLVELKIVIPIQITNKKDEHVSFLLLIISGI